MPWAGPVTTARNLGGQRRLPPDALPEAVELDPLVLKELLDEPPMIWTATVLHPAVAVNAQP